LLFAGSDPWGEKKRVATGNLAATLFRFQLLQLRLKHRAAHQALDILGMTTTVNQETTEGQQGQRGGFRGDKDRIG
jgi:hypothetical protein